MIRIKMFSLFACIFCFTMAIGLLTTNHSKAKKPHTCKFVTCPYKGLTVYKHAHTGAAGEPVEDEGSDCDMLDMIHFEQPELSYDECEYILFQVMK